MANPQLDRKENFTDKFREFLKYVFIFVLIVVSIPVSVILTREYLNYKPLTPKEYAAVIEFSVFLIAFIWLLSKSIVLFFNALYFAKNYRDILDRKHEQELLKSAQKVQETGQNKQKSPPLQESRGVEISEIQPPIPVPNEKKSTKKTGNKPVNEQEIITMIRVDYMERLPSNFSASQKEEEAEKFINFVGEKYGYRWDEVFSDVYQKSDDPEEILETAANIMQNK
jgi:ABC-type multidrug transport system fused ATPase/permease subunit